MKRSEVFSEALMEEFISKYPYEFLGLDIELVHQQKIIQGFRPDLIFRDCCGKFFIIEIQQHALDRNHIYRATEYRDLLITDEGYEQVEVILVANELPEKYAKLCRIHKIQTIIISKHDFIEKIYSLDPEIKINLEKAIQSETQEIILPSKIMQIYSKDKKMNDRNFPNISALYIFRENPNYPPDNDFTKPLEKPQKNTLIVNQEREFTHHYETPLEVFLNPSIASIKNFDSSKEHLYVWMEMISRYNGFIEPGVSEIILGIRHTPDYLQYENYIRGKIKRFGILMSRYQFTTFDRGYNIDLIRQDLRDLQSCLFVGSQRELQQKDLFAFDLEQNAGHLLKIYKKEKKGIFKNESSEWLNYYESTYTPEYGEFWITVKFSNIFWLGFQSIKSILQTKFERNDWIRIEGPFEGNRIPKRMLDLTEEYFYRLG